MIGYYVHHHGRGHLQRTLAVAARTGPGVGLSSLPRPAEWVGHWIELPRDDDEDVSRDPTAGGRLHWVPERHRGLSRRMAEISSWIDDVDPELMVVDVSVEVALLARLHGVPVVTMAQPGDRRDAPHALAHGIARSVVAPWPEHAHGVLRSTVDDRLVTVGAFSRFDDRPPVPRPRGDRRRVLLMLGAGGHDVTPAQAEAARNQTPDWDWRVLGGDEGPWVEDPWDELCAADVVITHAGQNAVAEVAAARRPAVIVPQARPFGEQDALAAALALLQPSPAVVRSAFPQDGWADLLEEADAHDGEAWIAWNDGQGAERAAKVLHEELARRGPVSR
ncbi:MAG: hypothetical protein EON52_12865 [Actinomycetales bacterium]|nr:MAG: hypothetical protein EON52_12865 [Actinomycetales bacterium]